MKKLMMAVVLVLGVFSLSVYAQNPSNNDLVISEDDADGRPVQIPVNEVPKVVMDAIKAKQKGIFFTQAERFWYRDLLTYQVMGRRFSEEWLFRVVDDGTVLMAEVDGR